MSHIRIVMYVVLHELIISRGGGVMIVLYLCAQLAVLYTYTCLQILIYYRLGQNQLVINKYAVYLVIVYGL